jgi:DNA-directed RNA polymerase specialized sigma24 family protein
MIEPRRITINREELFAQRYEWLLGLALQLTGGDPSRAEDLLHNAFIQFTLPRHDLPPVQNLEGYLYAMLRNVHVSQERQAANAQHLTVSIADYDSAEITLRATDARVRMRAREDLRAICHYACLRKEVSKVGGVLILRFFHDYFPNEVALIARCTRADVDRFLWQARREAKSYLENPGSLRFLDEQSPAAESASVASSPQPQDLPAELRAEIFRSRRGDCLSGKTIRDIYRKESSAQIDAARLAHFVACEQCLRLICKTLGLSPLSADDSADDSCSGSSGGAPPQGARRGPSADSFLKRSRRRAQETAEHKPKELRVSANGFFVGAQSVNAEVNEQVLQVNIEEPLAFIEATSEQGLRLLVMPVESPPAGAIEQRAALSLSDGRTLELTVNFRSAKPTLKVTYFDPSHCGSRPDFLEADCGLEEASDCGLRIADRGLEEGHNSPSPLFESFNPPQGLLTKLKSAFRDPQSAIHWLLRPLPLTLLLAIPLIAASVAPRLAPWFDPSPPRVRDASPVKPANEKQPAVASGADLGIANLTTHSTPGASPAASPSAIPASATAQLEIEALSLLSQSGGDVGEQVSVARTPDRRLRIEGLVETDARKAEILRALAPLAQNPAVQIEIKTIAEALRQANPRPSASIAVREFSATENEVPAADELRRYFAGEGAEVEERVRQYARHMAEHATQTMLHEAELRRLARRFSIEELGALDTAASARWLGLIRRRAGALSAQLNLLGDELRPIFFITPASSGSETPPELAGDAALLRAIEQLHDQCAIVDRRLRAAFTLPTGDAPATSQIRTAQFWRALTSAEALAAKIAAVKN